MSISTGSPLKHGGFESNGQHMGLNINLQLVVLYLTRFSTFNLQQLDGGFWTMCVVFSFIWVSFVRTLWSFYPASKGLCPLHDEMWCNPIRSMHGNGIYIHIYIYTTVGKIMALCELADYWLYHIWIRLKQNGFLSVNHILTYGLKNANPMKHKPHQSICHGSCERIHRVKHNWLAVSTPWKNMLVRLDHHPIVWGKIKHVPNHQPV